MTLPVITYTLSITSNNQTRPSVSGTKRKWYSAVAANCSRERSTSSSLPTVVSSPLNLGSVRRMKQAERFGRVLRVDQDFLAPHEREPQKCQQQELDDHHRRDRARKPGGPRPTVG